MMEHVKTINSAVRTLLLLILVVAIGAGGYLVYHEYSAQDRLVRDQQEKILEAEQRLVTLKGELAERVAEIDQLSVDLAAKIKEVERLETKLHLLKTDQRLAQLNVLDVQRNEAGEVETTRLEFVELSPQGDPISNPKRFELPGDVIYIDNWVVKFDDSFVEQADIERGTSLCLFRRIFSEQQVPTDGVSLDEIGMRPQAYARGGAVSEFEAELWQDFWEFANNPQRAQGMGIRAANGEAVSIKVREQMSYAISLRASGGLSIQPIEATP